MSSSSNILARGIRVPGSKVDAFLKSHNLHPTIPGHLRPSDLGAIPGLLTSLGVESKVRLFEPVLEGFKESDRLFLCYDWVYVLAEKQVEASLKKLLPEGFLEVVGNKILQDRQKAIVGTGVICFEQEWGLIEEEKFAGSVPIEGMPAISKVTDLELQETYKCGLCGVVLDTYENMFIHVKHVHGQEGRVVPPC